MYESDEDSLGRLSEKDGDGQCHRLGIVMEQLGSIMGLCALGEMDKELFLGRYVGETITIRK
jgi:hypothetical protein